jgi:hypothetical protein
MTAGLSVEQTLGLPAAFDIVTAGRAFGRGRTWCHEQARAGTFPLPLLRLGRSYVVRRADLIAYLGLDGSGADPPERRQPGHTLPGPPLITERSNHRAGTTERGSSPNGDDTARRLADRR